MSSLGFMEGVCEGFVMLDHFETRMANGVWRRYQLLYFSSLLLNVASTSYCIRRKEGHHSDHDAPWQGCWLDLQGENGMKCVMFLAPFWFGWQCDLRNKTHTITFLGPQNQLGSMNNLRALWSRISVRHTIIQLKKAIVTRGNQQTRFSTTTRRLHCLLTLTYKGKGKS